MIDRAGINVPIQCSKRLGWPEAFQPGHGFVVTASYRKEFLISLKVEGFALPAIALVYAISTVSPSGQRRKQ